MERDGSQTATNEDAGDEGSAFDDYVERALKGAPPAPEAFAASAGGALRSALERIYKRARGGADAGELPFERLGDYRLIRRLGSGGMGLVFLAEQESLGREVALKIVRPELRGSAVAAERFHREARAVAQLRHPHIVAVFAAGEERGVRYLALELVEGSNLDELLKRGELASVPLAQRVRWIAELARALDFAHQHGVIHRDVKPSNVRITLENKALLLDFGLARTSDSGDATLTDGFAGSPSYASPEQISKRGELDHRTDVYSLGVTLYQCVTGVVPFQGANVEQVFHRVLTGEPAPPRKLDASLPRDLETVILQAIARSPQRRYATAGALADDLEAVLELRPIRGRRQGAWERVRGGVRRHPALATAIATAALALVVSVIAFVAQRRMRVVEQRDEARRTVQLARDKIAAYRTDREALQALTARVVEMRRMQNFKYFRPDEITWFDFSERRAEELERGWEATFYEVLDLLRQAERLDSAVAGAESVRAELHFERFREARDAHDVGGAQFHRELVLEHDPDGAWARQIAGELVFSIASEPPGAQVHMFRMEELADLVEGGEPRCVPVPLNGTAPLEPDRWALLAVDDLAPLARGDLITELDGRPIRDLVLVAGAREPVRTLDRLFAVDGTPVVDVWSIENLCLRPRGARVAEPGPKTFVFQRDGAMFEVRGASLEELGVTAYTAVEFAALAERAPIKAAVLRDGERLELELPPAAPVRVTAAPFVRCRASAIGTTPLVRFAAPSASYALLLTRPGFEDHLITAGPGVGHIDRRVELLPLGTTPPEFVYVDDPDGVFWICEHEVTAGEYLEFVNDPATLREIETSPRAQRIPRAGRGDSVNEFFWERDASGLFEIPADWDPRWPVLGVTWDDALAYARWRTERDRARGLAREYSFPTLDQYARAGAGRFVWRYTWGTRFRAHWSHTCYSRPAAKPARVMQFPIDRSVYGVFDLCGGAFEWLDAWYDAGREQRWIGGGAWGHSDPGITSIGGGYGAHADASSGSIGMRLLVHMKRD